MNILIRKATINDAAALCDLGRKTFYEKWVTQTSAENMKKYLSENFTKDKMMEELSNPSVIHLVAEKENKLVAFAKLVFANPDIEEAEPEIKFEYTKAIEISRIYVLAELIGQSIGAMLMEKIFETAREENCDLVWLGVWGENPAISFYKRHGFAKAGTHPFLLGDQLDMDWVMIKSL